jgi:hypothetical protein
LYCFHKKKKKSQQGICGNRFGCFLSGSQGFGESDPPTHVKTWLSSNFAKVWGGAHLDAKDGLLQYCDVPFSVGPHNQMEAVIIITGNKCSILLPVTIMKGVTFQQRVPLILSSLPEKIQRSGMLLNVHMKTDSFLWFFNLNLQCVQGTIKAMAF